MGGGPEVSKIEYLRTLASKGAGLGATKAPSDADLTFFRDHIMARPDDLRRRLLGANVQRRRQLDAGQRRALDVLETTPDLLSPLAELRYEPSHSRLIAHFLDAGAEPGLAPRLLRAFLALVGKPEVAFADNGRDVRVEPERWLPSGRVDISITLPTCVVFVEMKVDSEEGENQLLGYRKDLDALRGSRNAILVYLTRPDAPRSSTAAEHVHVTLDRLLLAWLPFGGAGTGSEHYLSRYLKSLALVCASSGKGRFDDWTTVEQGAALDLIERLG